MNNRTAFQAQADRRYLTCLAFLPILLLAAGCGAATPATPTAPAPIPAPIFTTPAAAPTATTAAAQATQPSGGPATAKQYDHAPDYSWLAGQLKQDGACWTVTYVSPLIDAAPDQYNNHLSLLPGTGWDPA